MTRFLPSDEAVDFAESGRKRGQDRVACFLHLRDLVYLHPEAASASAVSCVRTIEARVIAAKAAREKGSGETRGRRDMADRRATEPTMAATGGTLTEPLSSASAPQQPA